MLNNTIKIALTLLVVFFLISCKDTADKSTNKKEDIMQNDEKQKISNLLSEYQKSLNTSDAKLARSLYTEDGVFMPSEAPSGRGSEAILKSYEFVFSQIRLNIEFSIEEIELEGNMAFAVTGSKGTVKIHSNGLELPEANRELFVFKKVNGDWKIARYMFNKTEPRAQ